MTFDDALRLMVTAHAGQLDKRGEPYVFHPLAVLGLLDLDGLSPQQAHDARIVAVLHDVKEDALSEWLLHADGYSQQVQDALDAVTRRDGEDYFDYVGRCKHNPIGRRVKIADLMHNLSEERRVGDPREEKRRSKYKAALRRLRG